jgi:glycosyltransferase involved in cell wall biosynthesis
MVSIVITCYNYGGYLARCVESALDQTYGDVEVIIVNDGSTDNTDEVAWKYMKDHPRVRYIRQKNAGQANAKNTGIRAATGEFIAFLDADDLWETNKLEKQMPLFSCPLVGVVYSRARYVAGNGLPMDVTPWGEHLSPRSGNVTEHLFFDNFIPFSSAVVRRKCLIEAGVFDESIKMGIDWDLWLRISVNYEFAYVDEPLLVYRVGHAGQMSKDLEERQRCADRIMRKFLSDNPGMIPKSTIRDALTYTYLSRGYFYETKDFKKSAIYHMMALQINPFALGVYRGIVRLIVRQLNIKLRIA